MVCGVRGGVVCGGGFMRHSGALGGSVVSFSIRVIKVLILGYFGWFEEVIVWCVCRGGFLVLLVSILVVFVVMVMLVRML